MGIGKIKTEGGQGGCRGHSNMEHFDCTEQIQMTARKQRRSETKRIEKPPVSPVIWSF